MLTVTLDLVNYKQHVVALADVPEKLHGLLGKSIDALSEVAVEAAKGVSPEGQHPFGVPDGYTHFKDDWKAEPETTGGWPSLTLENVSDHAAFVLNDTRPHEIRAVNATTLRFKGRSGETVYRRQVHHPGTKAKDILTPLKAALEPHIEEELQSIGKAAGQTFDRVFE